MKYKIIVVLTLVVSLLSGCTARKEMKIMSIDGYGSEDTVLIKDESFLEDVDYKTFIDDSIEKKRQFAFLGREFSLEYVSSVRKDFSSYSEDMYMTNDGVMVNFKKNSEELTMFAAIEGLSQDIFLNPAKEEDYKKISEEILAQYINLEEYEYSCTTDSPVKEIIDGDTEGHINSVDSFIQDIEGNPTYYMVYSRLYEGVPTSESAVVALNKSGDIIAVLLNSIGLFNGSDNIEVNESMIDEAVEKKALSLVKDVYECQCDIQSKMLCKNNDSYYIVVYVNIYVKNENNFEYKVPYLFAVMLD
ncbi:MAG: hypothetical protein IKP88_03700 [Lachnospiraceae bacterium]|nr:hypothetical protein [Lachnospiraceae bacterium]